jgi:hypothetical protein
MSNLFENFQRRMDAEIANEFGVPSEHLIMRPPLTAHMIEARCASCAPRRL